MFTEPKLSPENPTKADMSKEWRIWFRFSHNGKRKVISRKRNLNDIDSFTERLKYAKEMRLELHQMLKEGWNPITGKFPEVTTDDITFHKALDFAYEKKLPDWSEKSASDFKSVIRYLKEACTFTKPISEFKKADFRVVLEEVKKIRKLTNSGYNKYREYLSSLIGELCQWDIMEANPIEYIQTKKVKKVMSHRPPTEAERKLISHHLRTNHKDYYRFAAVEFGTTIRPVEISRLKVKDLIKSEGIFRLSADILKNATERDVPIPGWLLRLLSELDLTNKDHYIFGKGFVPGPEKLAKNASHNYWRKAVKQELKLNINQYALKKLAGNIMVNLQVSYGVDNLLEVPQRMMGHSDKSQTKVYVNQQEKIIKDLIQNQMPEL